MDMAVSSVECDVDSGLDFQETELKLALPGGRSAAGGAERKRGFSDTVEFTLGKSRRNNLSRLPSDVSSEDRQSVESAESVVCSPGKPPAAKAQVVGWPPVRSFRKNVLKKSCKYVKVAVDGAPYLRKVDLETYSGYQQLLKALEEMFACFTIGDSERRLVGDPISGIEYVPTYEDKEGDWMLVGDVPWKMFVESCKRIRLMKSSEAVNLAPRSSAKCNAAK